MNVEYESMSEDQKNAFALAELIVDPQTTPALQVKVINKLLEGGKNSDFFQSMVESDMSVGECPCCGHINHWLVPEEKLNDMGYVTYERDPRVKRETTIEDCPRYQESCMKKKINA